MYTIPFSMKISMFLARSLYRKFLASYKAQHHQKIPVILVAGTAGKSSMTLACKELFEKNGWNVFSGASEKKCLNSVTGIAMTLGGFYLDFEGKFGKFFKLWFIVKSLASLAFDRYHFDKKTMFVYEIGFNEQYESSHFTYVFENSSDLLILTNLTAEHSAGFSHEFDQSSFDSLHRYISPELFAEFENSQYDSQLKNIALEQIKLATTSKYIIQPVDIGTITNSFAENLSGTFLSHTLHPVRGNMMKLEVENSFVFNEQYLFPKTFAKVGGMLKIIAKQFEILPNLVNEYLNTITVPNGRFSKLEGKQNTTIIDSSYNSDPASLIGFLELFEEVMQEYSKYSAEQFEKEGRISQPKHTLILGEMRELGESSTVEHKQILLKLIVLQKTYSDYIDNIFLLGSEWLKCDDENIAKSDGDTRYISHNKNVFTVYIRAGDIKKRLDLEGIRPQSWYWIKGSQNTIFSEIVVEYLLQNKSDLQKLCRRGEVWDRLREKWN